jgi:peptidyl-prolyl cis-trans isomerase D
MSLESIRNTVKGPLGIVVISVIFFSFAIWGISANIFLSGSNAVATVDGVEITPQELEREVENSKRMFGNYFDQLYRTDEQLEQFRQSVLDQLINKKVLLINAKSEGARISNTELKESIQAIPNFQIGGKFDQTTYVNILAANNYTDARFRTIQADDLLRRQVQSIVGDTEIALAYEADLRYKLDKQKRSGRFVELKTTEFKKTVEVSEEEIETYFNDNQEQFRVPEKVIAEYLELSQEKLKSKIEVTDQEALEFYQQNSQEYVKPGPRKAAHILIISEDDDAVAKQKADEVYAQLEAGAEFAELAKTHSMDEDSAAEGGVIGFQNQGDLEDSLNEALFALEVGAYSAPVKSEFGYHILSNLENGTDVEIAFDDVKSEIFDTIKADKATALYFEKQDIMAEKAFEYADSLTEVAEEVGLELMTSDPFPLQGGTGLSSNPVFAEAAFGAEVYDNAVNSEVLEIGENHVVVLRIKEKEASHIKALTSVTNEIKEMLITEKALEKAKVIANQLIENSANESSLAELMASNQLTWSELKDITRASTGMPIYVRNELFLAPASGGLPTTKLAEQGDSAIAVVELAKVTEPAAMTDADKATYQNQVKQNLGQHVFQQYVTQLRKDSEITKN